MSGCSLVHEPCRRPEKIGGLAQVLQRRTPTWSDRPTDADYVAESRWRSQPATVKEAGKLYLPAIQSSASLQVQRYLKLKLVRRIKAGHMLLATAARLAKAREKRKNSCRFGVHSENLGYVYFLYENCCPRRRRVCFVSF